MGKGLYIGKEVDPATGALGSPVELDPSDLTTHGLIVGMTGSGKTGLAIALIEELLAKGIPVLAVDPKGDLGNLLLLSPDLQAASFAPWIDPDMARREGKDVATAAADAAAQWKKGLADWGLGAADVAALARAREAVVLTPGSEAGVPLNILHSLDPPSVPFDSDEEDLRDEIAGFVAGLLGLVGIEADPLRSREFILLTQVIEKAWRDGRAVSLESMIPAVADPPFEKMGALPLETVYPRRERQQLMMALNNLLASPAFAAWRVGEALDVERLLRAADGRPRLSIVYTAHLTDHERLFVTALILNKVKTWVRRQGGTSALRAVLYVDEIFGYFPPHPADPPTKRPLLTLLKQARAQGLGVVLATQNPVDLDYKGLANTGLWFVGRLQTEQDRARLRDGLVGAGVDGAAIDRLLAATKKRVFLMHDIHRPGPLLVHSRWAMSYLRGPLTRDEVARLAQAGTPAAAPPTAAPSAGAPWAAAPSAVAPAAAAAAPPISIAGLDQAFLNLAGADDAAPFLFVKYAVRYKGAGEAVGARAYPIRGASVAEVLEADPIEVPDGVVSEEAPPSLRFSAVPDAFAAASARAIEKAVRDRLADRLTVTVMVDPLTRATSRPGEPPAAFAARVGTEAAAAKSAKLREKLERKRRDLAAREEEMAGRKTEKWAAVGTAVLSNVFGRGRGLSGAGSVLTKNRMENAAEARVAALKAEVATLEHELATFTAVDPTRFEPRMIVPSRSQVTVLRMALLWVY